MPTTSPQLPAKPPADIPFGDYNPITGTLKINPAWDAWLKAVETVLRKVRSEIP